MTKRKRKHSNRTQAQHNILKSKGRKAWKELKRANPDVARERLELWKHFKSI